MKIQDGRGKNKMAEGETNKAAIKKWFKDNPGSTIAECCRGLDLVYRTVKKHVVAIQEEADK